MENTKDNRFKVFMAGVISGRGFESAYELIHEATTYFDARDELERQLPDFITLREFRAWLDKFCNDTFEDRPYKEAEISLLVRRIYGYFNYVPLRDYVSHDDKPSDPEKVGEADVFYGLANYIMVQNGWEDGYKNPYRGYGKDAALAELCKAFATLGILTRNWKQQL